MALMLRSAGVAPPESLGPYRTFVSVSFLVVHVTTIVVSLAPKLRWTPLGSCDFPALAVDASARVSKIVSHANALRIAPRRAATAE